MANARTKRDSWREASAPTHTKAVESGASDRSLPRPGTCPNPALGRRHARQADPRGWIGSVDDDGSAN
jgi:hypothetical protein